MQWWNDFLEWFWSADGQRVLTGVLLPFVAVLLAGLIGAGVGRSATKRLIDQRDRETRAAAVAALVTAGTHAATWHSQSAAAKDHSQQLAAAADIQVRLLPIAGADLAADWAAHELDAMRANSVSFSFQADESLRDYRDRLLAWVRRPRRAKRLFALDLESWKYESGAANPLLAEQTQWAEDRLSGSAAPTIVVDPEPASPASPAR